VNRARWISCGGAFFSSGFRLSAGTKFGRGGLFDEPAGWGFTVPCQGGENAWGRGGDLLSTLRTRFLVMDIVNWILEVSCRENVCEISPLDIEPTPRIPYVVSGIVLTKYVPKHRKVGV